MSSNRVTIDVTPKTPLIDDVIHIVVKGLSPCHHSTLVCRVSENNARFFSTAIYRSDVNGEIDVSKMAALDGGSYDGVEPMGLIWSMSQEPGQKPGRRMLKSDVTTPLITHLYVLHGMIPSDECLSFIEDENWLAYVTFDRLYMAEGVKRIEVRQGRLVGTLFIPVGLGPFPGVLDLFGTEGGVIEERAALLASHGLASLALGYYQVGKNKVVNNDLEYFMEGLDYLLGHEQVLKPHAGVLSISVGGVRGIALGTFSPKVDMCIAINSHSFPRGHEIKYRGERLSHNKFDYDTLQYSDAGAILKYSQFAALSDKMNSLPVENGSCTYILIHGDDDQCTDPVIASYIPSRLKRHGKKNYHLFMYNGAGHLILPPYGPLYYATYQKNYDSLLLWGGRKREHAKAQEDSWRNILYFLKQKLATKADGVSGSQVESRL